MSAYEDGVRDVDGTDSEIAAHHAMPGKASTSPFGPDDEIGMLNLITPASRDAVMRRADATRVFDLSVDYFVGMPSVAAFGDPPYQIWMDHTPRGTVVDNATALTDEHNATVSYSGDSIAMYTHTGTHIDTLNHYGYCGEIWNHRPESKHLGSRHWDVCGADKHPPVIARGVLLDIAGLHGIDTLEPLYEIDIPDIEHALKRQKVTLQKGDVVLINTGRMELWPSEDFAPDEPGIIRRSAEYLCEAGTIMIGADNLALERLPSPDADNWCPVHAFMLAEAGVPLLEMAVLKELAAEKVYEFAFVAACLRLRGATGSPLRPLAFPFRPE